MTVLDVDAGDRRFGSLRALVGGILMKAQERVSDMGETIRVSDEFYSWVESRKRDDESMEDALRRLTRGPHPSEVAGLFTPEEAEEMKEAVKRLRRRDRSRLERAREAFSGDE